MQNVHALLKYQRSLGLGLGLLSIGLLCNQTGQPTFSYSCYTQWWQCPSSIILL